MSVVKVTRKYQITVPERVRRAIGLRVGDKVLIEYDKEEDAIMVRPLKPVARKRFLLGRKMTVEDVERAIREGLRRCLNSKQ